MAHEPPGKPPTTSASDEPPEDEDPKPQSSTNYHARRARDGDPLAWANLIPRLREMLLVAFARERFALGYTIEDLIGITLKDVLRDLGKFKFGPDANFRGWVMRIAKNNHLDLLRRADRDKSEPSDIRSLDDGSDSSPGLRGRVPDKGGDTPSMHARLGELQDALRAALAKLRPETRRVIELHLFQHLSFKAIACKVGREKEETVKAIYHRGLEKLGGELEGFR